MTLTMEISRSTMDPRIRLLGIWCKRWLPTLDRDRSSNRGSNTPDCSRFLGQGAHCQLAIDMRQTQHKWLCEWPFVYLRQQSPPHLNALPWIMQISKQHAAGWGWWGERNINIQASGTVRREWERIVESWEEKLNREAAGNEEQLSVERLET